MKRLICLLFRHRWSDWSPIVRSFWMCGNEGRTCTRCDKHEYRWDFEKHMAVGSTIRVKFPERWTVMNQNSLHQAAALAPPSSADVSGRTIAKLPES